MAYSYSPIKNILSYAVALEPDGAFPLDARAYFGSYEAAKAAALTAEEAGSSASKYFFGQQVYVVKDDVVTTYLITRETEDRLKLVGKEYFGDNKTITIDGSTVSLHGFGKGYYAYKEPDVVIEGEFSSVDELTGDYKAGDFAKVEDVWYTYYDSAWSEAGRDPKTTAYYEFVEGSWKAGLEPKAKMNAAGDGYELAWYEPSTTTVEGLSSLIASVKTSVDEAEAKIALKASNADLEAEADRATKAEATLDEKIGKNTTAIATLNGDASTEGSVKKQIADAIANILDNPDEAKNSIQELVDWISEHEEVQEALDLDGRISSNANAIDVISKWIGDYNTEDYGTIAAYLDSLHEIAQDACNEAYNNSGSIDTINNELGEIRSELEFNVASLSQGLKADSAVQSITKKSNGVINVTNNTDDDAVTTEVTVYELPVAAAGTLGGVKSSSSIAIASDGTATVAEITTSNITDFDTKVDNKIVAVKTEIEDAAADTYVKQDNVIAAAADVASDVTAASSEKVISEKVLLELFSWKTSMTD